MKEVTPETQNLKGISIPKGIVKWYVEMIDNTEEITGVATILTMVRKKS
jgi:oxepin-CoA hydrolase/3-oxo-5,6-dehydrosuberyl-CoA semialdehyde dehydrogenase